MPIISNLTDRPVLLAFNSGQTLRLSPRSASEEIPDVEIVNNAKVAKLTAEQIIAIEAPKRRAASAGAERTGETEAPAASVRATTSAKSDKPAKRS